MKNKLKLISAIIFCELIGIAGSIFTIHSIPTWYATLNKPSFIVPNWLFGPVWTILYAMIAVVLFMLWKKGFEDKQNFFIFKIFVGQLMLNAIWTPIFFGLKNLKLAFVVIILLWLSIIWLVYLLRKNNKTAAWLLVPYLLWVSFASVLNFSFMMLN